MELSGHQGNRVGSGLERQLHLCVECGSNLVHPLQWKEAGPDRWNVTLRCPNCEWTGGGTYGQPLLDAFDQELDDGAHALMRDLRVLAHANMAADVERFIGALWADAVLPEDF